MFGQRLLFYFFASVLLLVWKWNDTITRAMDCLQAFFEHHLINSYTVWTSSCHFRPPDAVVSLCLYKEKHAYRKYCGLWLVFMCAYLLLSVFTSLWWRFRRMRTLVYVGTFAYVPPNSVCSHLLACVSTLWLCESVCDSICLCVWINACFFKLLSINVRVEYIKRPIASPPGHFTYLVKLRTP